MTALRDPGEKGVRYATGGFLLCLALAVGCAEPPPGQPGTTAPPAEAADPPLPPPRTRVVETGPLHIDRIFPSMEGPFDRVVLDTWDLDWVRAFRTEVIDADDGTRMGDEFFCHSQMQLVNTTRLMVTATGIEDIEFPPGFAMPVSQILTGVPPSEREVTLLGMVLNNHEPLIDRNARVRWTIEYYRHEDVGTPPRVKKLYKVGLPMTVGDLGALDPVAASTGDVTTHCVLVEGLKVHWLVSPGPQTTRRRFQGFMPVDGTVHFGVVHMHAYGVYMRLTDVTTGDVLWQTDVRYEPGRKQISEIPRYSSVEGFPIYKDHVYEIEAFYDNTTDREIDAMAMMDLYYHPAGDENIVYPVNPDADARPAHL